ISAIADQTSNEDTPTSPIPFVVQDRETAANNLVLTASSANTSLVPNQNIIFAGNGTNRTVTITPATNQFGTALITIGVTDGNGASANESFQLTVNSINDPPTLNAIPDVAINEDAGPQTVSLSGITSGAA